MRRGEVWQALIGEETAVVVLSEPEAAEVRAIQIVAPATPDQRRGYVVLSGDEAMHAVATGADMHDVAIEIAVGVREGLPYDGVVRVGVPRSGVIPCTWLVTMSPDSLGHRIAVLTPAKLAELSNALRMAAME